MASDYYVTLQFVLQFHFSSSVDISDCKEPPRNGQAVANAGETVSTTSQAMNDDDERSVDLNLGQAENQIFYELHETDQDHLLADCQGEPINAQEHGNQSRDPRQTTDDEDAEDISGKEDDSPEYILPGGDGDGPPGGDPPRRSDDNLEEESSSDESSSDGDMEEEVKELEVSHYVF